MAFDPASYDVSNRKPTWYELRLLGKFKASKGQDFEAITELILRRTNCPEGELDEADVLEVMALVSLIAAEVIKALGLMKLSVDWDKALDLEEGKPESD